MEAFFPNGWAHYLAGGLVLGAGMSLLFAATGLIGGMSTVFTTVAVTFITYQLLPRTARKPWLAESFGKHASEMSARTLLGAAIFGVGWGLCGVCPGPAIAGLGVGNWPLLYALAGLAAGAFIQGRFFAPKAP